MRIRSLPRSLLTVSTVALLCCALTVSVGAAEKSSSYQAALESIKTDDLNRHVGRLADEAMEGREAGSQGGWAAAKYLTEQYTRLKIHGAGTNGGFFQPFSSRFRNVLAIIEGSDPKLRDQAIVVCAHYDHIGYGYFASLGPSGYIHPGADDNASGTAAILELAEAMTFFSSPPKRSIIFAHWDAEEKGLLGSKHWVAHPTVSLNRVAVAVNLDMIGRLRDERLMIYGSRSGRGWRRLLSLQNDAGLRLVFPWGIKPRADHYPFFARRIPVLMFHTGLHDDYHRPGDLPKRINGSGMTQVTRLLFGVVYELADNPSAIPDFRAAAHYETPANKRAVIGRSAKPTDRLGVSWREDTATAGGVRVSTIATDSPARKAGLREGDLIVRFAGREIHTDDDFFAAVSSAANPATATVKRPAEEKPLELTLQLTGVPLRWGITWRVDDAEPGMVVLTHVVPGSPAAHAGLAGGDRVYRVAGQDFADEVGFVRLVKSLDPTLQLLVERDGRMRIVMLRIKRIKPHKRAA